MRPLTVRIDADSYWMPRGYVFSDEARLETFGPRVFPNHPAWQTLTSWWLKHPKGANTPNWDFALRAEIEGQAGLVLVEAKANEEELVRDDPKRGSVKGTPRSVGNDERIRAAIEEAREALEAVVPGISISCDNHYQLSNRIAFAWKLASLGLPVALVYLGFTGDVGIGSAGRPFSDHEDWLRVFNGKCMKVWPAPPTFPIQTSNAPLWIVTRSRQVLESSPPAKAL